MENKKIWTMRPYTEINNKTKKKNKQYTTLRDPKTTKKNKKTT